MRLIGDPPTAGEIAGVAVRAALAVARTRPDCSMDRLADLASGHAIAKAALRPAADFTVELIEAAVRADLPPEKDGETVQDQIRIMITRLVEDTGLSYGNAATMARAAVVMAEQIGFRLADVMDNFEARYSKEGGYRLVHNGVVLAHIAEPLKPRRRFWQRS